MMADRDLLALAPTGSGKTLGYLLPLLTLLKAPAPVPKSSTQAKEGSTSSEESDESEGEASTSKPKSSVSPRALILSPTHELALQIASETLKLTQGRKWRVVVLTKANEISVVERGADILICTPQRLVSCIEKRGLSLAKSVLQSLLASTTWSNLASTFSISTKHLVIDESDRLLDKTFLPVVDTILSELTDKSLRRALFTATLPSDLEEIARGMGTGESVRVIVGMKCVPFLLCCPFHCCRS